MRGNNTPRFQPLTLLLLFLSVVAMEALMAVSGTNVLERKANTTKQEGADGSDGFRVPRSNHKIVSESAKDAELNCPIASRTSQHVEWYKKNPNGRGRKRITQFGHRYQLSSLGTMKIYLLTFEDAGTYYCKVANKSDVHSILLVVTGEEIKNNHLKPHPTKKGSNENNSGEEVLYTEPQILRNLLPKEKVYHVAKGFPILLLKCESSGVPQPSITWYKNGVIISSSTTNVSTLKLLNISQADNGLYKCESVNLFGVSRYEVTIQMTDYWFGAAEILNLSPRNITVQEGGVVNISCTAKFELDPWFSWVRKVTSNKTESGKVFFHSGTDSYYEVLKSTMMKVKGEGVYSTELMITNVTRNYSGVYYCAVAGLQGFNLSDATITVESSPTGFFVNERGIAAQWAILWTVSFVFLVMSVILCFIKLYGCRQSKRSPKPVPSKKSLCNLPESSPLTMSTHCTTTQGKDSFVPLMVGSCSGLSSYVEGSEYDEDSTSAPNYYVYPENYLPASSWVSSNSSCNDCESLRSYRPNSMCSDYHCNSSISKPSNSCHKACCHRIGVVDVGVHNQFRISRQPPRRTKKKSRARLNQNNVSSWDKNHHRNSDDASYCLSTDCESCESEIVRPKHKNVYPSHHPPLDYIYDHNEHYINNN